MSQSPGCERLRFAPRLPARSVVYSGSESIVFQRTSRLVVAILAVLSFLQQIAHAQLAPLPEGKPYTKDQQAWLTERAKIVQRIRELEKSDLDEAVQLSEKMLTLDRQVFGNIHKEVAISLDVIDSLYFKQQQYFSAIKAREEIIEITSKLLGERHWRVRQARFWRDRFAMIAGFRPDQQKAYEKAEELRVKAEDYYRERKFPESQAASAQAADLYAATLGKNGENYAERLHAQGNCSLELRQLPEALAFYSKAAEVRLALLGEDSLNYAWTQHQIGIVFAAQGNPVAAEKAYRTAMRVLEKEGTSREKALVNQAIGATYLQLARYASAEECFGRAIDYATKSGDFSADFIIRCQLDLIDAHMSLGKLDDAETLGRNILKTAMKPDSRNELAALRATNSLCRLLNARGQKGNEILGLIEETLKLPDTLQPESANYRCLLRFRESEARLELHDYSGSFAAAKQAYQLSNDASGPRTQRCMDAVQRMLSAGIPWTQSLYSSGKSNEAEQVLRELQELSSATHAEQSTSSLTVDQSIKMARRFGELSPDHRKDCREHEQSVEKLQFKVAADLPIEIRTLEAAIQNRQGLFGDNDLLLNQWMTALGGLYQRVGHSNLAEPMLAHAERFYLEQYGAERAPRLEFTSLLKARAVIFSLRRDYESALAKLLLARRLLKSDLNALPSLLVDVSIRLARCHLELGELDRARPLLMDALVQATRKIGSGSEFSAMVLCELSDLEWRSGDYAAAEKRDQEMTAIIKGDPVTAEKVGMYARSAVRSHNEYLLNWALEAMDKGTSHIDLPEWNSSCLWALARVALVKGDIDEADRRLKKVIDSQSQRFPGIHQAYEREMVLLDVVGRRKLAKLVESGQWERSFREMTDQATTWSKLLGEKHWRTRDARNREAVVKLISESDEQRKKRFQDVYQKASQVLDRTQSSPEAITTNTPAILAELESLVPLPFSTTEYVRQNYVYALLDARKTDLLEAQTSLLIERARSIQGNGELLLWGYIDLAKSQELQGEFLKAETSLNLANVIAPSVGGRDFIPTAFPNVLLGANFASRGSWLLADDFLRKAFPVVSRDPLVYSQLYLDCLCLYGNSRLELGDPQRAAYLLERASQFANSKAIARPAYSALSTTLLGNVHAHVKNTAKAETLFKEAIAAYQRLEGKASNNACVAILGLANLNRDKGEHAISESLYQKVIEDFVAHTLSDSAFLAGVYASRARLHLQTGNLEKARADYDSAIQIRSKRSLGTDGLYFEMLDLEIQSNRLDLARKAARDGFQSVFRNLTWVARVQQESQQFTSIRKLDDALGRVLSLTGEGENPEETYALVLAWKGAIFARQQSWRQIRSYPPVQKKIDAWEKASGRLATLALHVPYPEDRDLWLMQVRDATDERDRLEIQIGESLELPGSKAMPDIEKIKNALPDKTALVDIVEYLHRVPKQKEIGQWDEIRRVVAFVVRKGESVKRVDLGPATALTEKINAWLAAVVPDESGKTSTVKQLATLGRPIRQLIWDRLQPELGDVQSVLFSPDGALARMPLMALPGKSDQEFLAEEIGLIYIPVPSLLPDLMAAPPPPNDGALVAIGDVNYGGTAALADARRILKHNPDGTRSWLPVGFSRLQNTGPEVDSVRAQFVQTFPANADIVLKQVECSEVAFRQQAPRARWLHLATHGFYAPDLMNAVWATNRSTAETDPIDFHPGLLSGLAFANANMPGKPDEDDGILSALEVSAMDLSRVELAVLSACETALGQQTGGEGLVGLQRAFHSAGARNVLGTMWPIHDAATRLLMMRFYRNLWQKKMSKQESLREAQLWIIRSARAAERSGRKPTSATLDSNELPSHLQHPFIWAPFILSGDGR